jgi:putative FmdB family regulatory protein
MPIYEYQCQQCKQREEVIQKFTDPPLTHCQSCGGDMKKLYSSPAIQFKGSGFYKNDYASAGSKADTAAKSSETKSTTSETKSETKSESKSETKSETKSEAKPAAKSAE